MSDTEITMYPVEIAKAIIAVKKQIKQIGSDERNEHGRYNYVSVDKFYDRFGKMMAEAGLALIIDETDSDIKAGGKEGNAWLFAHYELRFVHESGAVSPSLRRSLAMPISGPQAYGAAQSYIEKQFLRQVFKIPTGEKDADETAQTDAPPPRQAPRAGMVRAADVPPQKANGNSTVLPVSAEEPPEMRLKRAAVQLATSIAKAPTDHVLDVLMDDARDDLAAMEKVQEPIFKFSDGVVNGVDAAKRLRARANAKIGELRSGK
jgi:hypothetical protein